MWLYGAFLYGTLLLCAVVTCITLRRYDLRPTEPLKTVAFAIILGAGLMWASRAGQDAVVRALISEERPDLGNLAYAGIAGVLEESAKLLTVIALCGLFRRHFEEHSDGVYYGALAGLGSAILESFLVLGWPSSLEFLPTQEPVRIAGHLVMGSITCAGLGLFAVGDRRWMWAVPLFFVLGCVLHMLWDWAAFEAADSFRGEGVLRWYHTGSSILIMLTGLFGFKALVKWSARMQERGGLVGHTLARPTDTIRP